MADFLNNKEVAILTSDILLGVELHKKIDAFTDNHKSVKSSVKILRKTQGKYAPVVVDILFDYILTQNWDKYSGQKIENFIQNIYIVFIENLEVFPEKIKVMIPMMIKDNFLMSCSTEDRLKMTFNRVNKRAKFENHFSSAHIDLFENYEELENHFLDFFPDLIAHVNEFCDCN